jgi:glutamine phosphoribosylpyrophosphate amidotransferase
MCEILAVSWPTPRPFTAVSSWALHMEYYGQANFGWGVAWLDQGRVRRYRNPGRMSTDSEGTDFLENITSTHFLVHFRRPSKLSTIGLADTQPFVDDDGQLAFVHNGGFTHEPEYRSAYEDRLTGAADSEVGYLMLRDLLSTGVSVPDGLAIIHGKLGGNANLTTLDNAGTFVAYSSYPANRFWRFKLGDGDMASTQLHSADDSIFSLIFAGATDRSVIDGSVTF